MKLRKTIVGYLLCGFFMFFLFGIFCSNLFAAYTQTYKIEQNTTTERSTLTLVGDMRINRISTATANADIIFQSSGTYPMQLYRGDLQIVTTGYGITFPDGSLQISAGVGGIVDTLSSTGTVVINSDSDNSGAESIIFRTAGAMERIRLVSSGNIGIGTTSPISSLHTTGGVSIGIDTVRTSGYDFLQVGQGAYGAGTALGNALVIRNDNAAASGSPAAGIYSYARNNADNAYFVSGVLLVTKNAGANTSYMTFGTADGADAAEKMRITNSGNVGIGTTNPAQKVHIVGPTLTSAQVDWNLLLESEKIASPSDGTGIGIKFKHDTGSATKWCGIAATATDAWSNSMDLRFYTRLDGESPATKMTIGPNGNVGIGTTSPAANLEVKAITTSADGILRLNHSTNDTATSAFDLQWYGGVTLIGGIKFSNPSSNVSNMEFSNWNGSTRTVRMGIYGVDGNVGIGTTAPTEKLEVNNGNIKTNYGVNAATGTFSGTLTVATITLSAATTRYYNISPGKFVPVKNTYVWRLDTAAPDTALVAANTDTGTSAFFADVSLPHGAIVTSVKAFWYNAGIASGTCGLMRKPNLSYTSSEMANVDVSATTGDQTIEDTTISNAIIDNGNYCYYIDLICSPVAGWATNYLYNILITYTINSPLP